MLSRNTSLRWLRKSTSWTKRPTASASEQAVQEREQWKFRHPNLIWTAGNGQVTKAHGLLSWLTIGKNRWRFSVTAWVLLPFLCCMASSKMILHDTGQKVINQTANKYLSSEQVSSQFPYLSCHRLPRQEVEHSRELAGSPSNSVRPALPIV